MAYIVMAYIVIAQSVMAPTNGRGPQAPKHNFFTRVCAVVACFREKSYGLHRYGQHSYGLYGHGLHTHVLHSDGMYGYDLCSYGLCSYCHTQRAMWLEFDALP